MSFCQTKPVVIIGGGLAGSECALQLARMGVQVNLYEMRPITTTGAHHTDYLAELVCSNSFKSLKKFTAAGVLKRELEMLNSPLMKIAFESQVPAGNALAVDRNVFSIKVSQRISDEKNISLFRQEVTSIPEDTIVVIASGPLSSEKLTNDIFRVIGGGHLSFFDAAAPIVDAESLNYEKLSLQSRYDEEGAGDYLNACMNKEEYMHFYNELLKAKKALLKDFEQKDLFQACQPVEEIARTGVDSLRFGSMKPVGLLDKRTNKKPYAAVQLRAENVEKTAYNLVGFQTNLTFSEQERVFRLIPGLEDVTFLRYGVMHRNTFIDAPRVLNRDLTTKGKNHIYFAGQITGTEGYTEAIASGQYVARNIYARLSGKDQVLYPIESVQGSLFAYATNPNTKNYQPMHVNFGLVPPLLKKLKKRERYQAYAKRALSNFDMYIKSRPDIFIDVKDD